MRKYLVAAALVLASCATAQTPAPAIVSPLPAGIARDASASLNPADAPAGAYTLDGHHASVVWRVRHTGIGLFTARFDTISGSLNLDPAAPQNSTINAAIAAGSVSTGVLNRTGERAFDAEIANTLGATANPNITFVSNAIELTGPTSGLIRGDLTLNGQTHPVALEANFHGGRLVVIRGKYVLGFSGRTIIRRSEWGVTNWAAFTGDEVEILIDAEFVKD